MAVSRRAFLFGSRTVPGVAGSAVVGEACLAHSGVVCRNCGDACETGAIAFLYAQSGVPRPVIDPQRCTACSECLPACPVGAMRIDSGEPA